MPLLTLDLFCRIIDNYGDAGIAWRLARQLADEHNLQVRLWIDRLDVLGKMESRLDPTLPQQHLAGVEICEWPASFPDTEPADAVVEAFGCPLPPEYLDAMAKRQPAPVWINLEYLSAETWVEGCHGLPSPHPRLPLTQYFFYPGFSPCTGGLLREHDLAERREAAQYPSNDFWQRLRLPRPEEGTTIVSLFCYPNPALASLFKAWEERARPMLLLAPGGTDNPALATFPSLGPWQKGSLRVQPLPFLNQREYDELLWACDLNFVRGEDSFVRALWAARPFIWHIYPQSDQAHLTKLNAFLDRYTETLARPPAFALKDFHECWNGGTPVGAAWNALAGEMKALRTHAQSWEQALRRQTDLASQLVIFINKKL